jgi:hypothetical protein
MTLNLGWLGRQLEKVAKEVSGWPIWMKRAARFSARRKYSMSGWLRGADGIYRNGESIIFRRGRKWVRQDPVPEGDASGWQVTDEEYVTLHAAIKQQRTEDAPLFAEPSETRGDC